MHYEEIMSEKTMYEKYHTKLPDLTEETLNNMPEELIESIIINDEMSGVSGEDTPIEESMESAVEAVKPTTDEAPTAVDEKVLDTSAETISKEDPATVIESVKKEAPILKEEPVAQAVKENLKIPIVEKTSADAFSNYQQYLNRTIRSSYFVVLPLSGYTADVRGLTIEEIDTLQESYEDFYAMKLRTKEIIFNCIQKSSVPLDFERFKAITAISEIKILLFGILIKTFGKINNFDFNCSHCGDKNSITVDLNSVLRVETETTLTKINAIQKAEDPELCVTEAVKNKIQQIFLPDTKILLEAQIPNFSKEDEVLKFFRDRNKSIENSTLYSYLTLVKTLYIPYISPEGEIIGYTPIISTEESYNYLNNMTKPDKDAFLEKIQELDQFDVSFAVEKIPCKSCGKPNKVNFDVAENFITTVLIENL